MSLQMTAENLQGQYKSINSEQNTNTDYSMKYKSQNKTTGKKLCYSFIMSALRPFQHTDIKIKLVVIMAKKIFFSSECSEYKIHVKTKVYATQFGAVMQIKATKSLNNLFN